MALCKTELIIRLSGAGSNLRAGGLKEFRDVIRVPVNEVASSLSEIPRGCLVPSCMRSAAFRSIQRKEPQKTRSTHSILHDAAKPHERCFSKVFVQQKLKKSMSATVLLSKPESPLEPCRTVGFGNHGISATPVDSLKLTTLLKSKIIPFQSIGKQGPFSERETRRRWTTKTATWMM